MKEEGSKGLLARFNGEKRGGIPIREKAEVGGEASNSVDLIPTSRKGGEKWGTPDLVPSLCALAVPEPINAQRETPTRSVFALASIISSTRVLGGASLSRVVGSGPFAVK